MRPAAFRRRGKPLYFYEGRTVRGIGLIVVALGIQLLIVVLNATAVAALALMLPTGLVDPASGLSTAVVALTALCGVYLGEAAMGIVFLLGYRLVYGGRHEYGLGHAQSLDRSTLFLVAFAVIAGLSFLYSLASEVFSPGIGGVPVFYLLTGNGLFAPAGAFFAGLALTYSVRALHPEGAARRFKTATVLGVAGAAAAPLLVLLVVSAGNMSPGVFASGIIASAVLGNGLAALSLLLFMSEYREARRSLEAGNPPPVLPRFAPGYPAPSYPAYPPPPPRP